MSQPQSTLYELAEAAGISTHWTHADDYDVKVEDGPLRRILTAMDLPCETEVDCRRSLAELDEEKKQLALPPMLTAWCGQPIRLDAASGLHGHDYELTVDGRTERGSFPSDRSLPLALPRIATPGYHTLEVAGRRITLALAPTRCFNIHDISIGQQRESKYWSLAVQLYALRRRGDAGVGDFTALRMLAEEVGRRGAAALTISPVHAMLDQGIQHFSPYSPSSRLFLNALHIDPATILDRMRFDAAVNEDICSARLRAELEEATMIDWSLASNWRINLLRRMFERFKAEGGDQDAFAAFRREQGEALEDHARFEALHSYFAMQGLETFWPKWPEAYRHPRRREVEAFAHEHADEVAFHAFLQWQAARGMEAAQQAARAAGMPIGLISDLAVGSDRGGSQAWSRQEEMLNQLSIGAPPDHFNPRGQNWGLVTLSPRAMRRSGFHAYLEMVRANLRYAGGVRIDHILGLARLWLIPPDSPPECGAYLRYPMEDMLRLLALESHRHRAIVIGENLGTIPEGFNEKIVGAGVLGMQVLWFLRKGNDFLQPSEWRSDGIGMTTTHDLPTVTGWWKGCDIAWKDKLDLFDKDASRESETHQRAIERRTLRHALDAFQADEGNDAIEVEARPSDEEAPLTDIFSFVGATPAPLVVVPLEDVLANAEQPNLPGTVDEHPNWRRRMSVPVDMLFDVPAVERRIAALADARSKVRP